MSNLQLKSNLTLSDEQKTVVETALNTARHYSPDSVPSMPYGVPGLRLKGKPLIAVAAHKQHYGIYPFSPDVIEAALPLIGGRETAKGTIRFDYGDEPPYELIERLVALRTDEITGNRK